MNVHQVLFFQASNNSKYLPSFLHISTWLLFCMLVIFFFSDFQFLHKVLIMQLIIVIILFQNSKSQTKSQHPSAFSFIFISPRYLLERLQAETNSFLLLSFLSVFNLYHVLDGNYTRIQRFDKILEVALNKTEVVQPLNSRLINYPSKINKTCWSLLEIQGQTHERHSLVDIVTANSLKSQNGNLFSHVWRRGRLALDPL